MIGSNKILTVSYGTFSCTLEGFDEPFSTMKAIAEYFRDLAADDRYFGAEPPTPDAEMLSRIAEREIQRRVEAKISEHGVVLRQTESQQAPAPMPVAIPMAAAAAAVVTEAAAAEPVEIEPAPAVEAVAEAPATAIAIAEEPAAEAPAEEMPAAETVAETLEAEEAEAIAAEPAADMVEAASEMPAEPLLLEPMAAAEPSPEAEFEDEGDDLSIDALMAEADDDGFEEAPEPAVATAAFDDAREEPEPESIAAKLLRIRAVVEGVRAGHIQAYAEEEEAPLVEAAAPVAEDFGFALDADEDSPDLRAAEAARAAERAAAEAAEAEMALAEADEEADEMAAAADEAEFDLAEAGQAEIASADVLAAPAVDAAAEAEAIDEEDLDLDDEEMFDDEEDAFDDEEETNGAPLAAKGEDDELLARLSALGMTARAEPEAPKPQAAEAAAGFMDDEGEADDGDSDIAGATAEATEAPQPSFYQRARARVIRLSKVATILGHSESDEPAKEDRHDAANLAESDEVEAGEFIAPAADPTDEDPDLSRLMEEARTKLEGAETRRRFSAISHLKAAVAATLADRKLNIGETPAEQKAGEEAGMELYREDLSKAVRPRRPSAEAGASTPRPTMELRPAPLVLVSEQRIDRSAGAGHEAGIVRPRRVAAGNLAVLAENEETEDEDQVEVSPENASNFAEFAGKLGATTLTELLEAAAVYTASVEGRPHFTRPHLLRKVEFVSTRTYNREDGLRSFGTLLRQGKIQKISRGQFTVTDTSRFMSEARRVH